MFATNYFEFIKPNFKNQIYYSIAVFLSNRQDNFVKDHHNPSILNENISIVDKFFYAKRFYRNEDF